MLKIERKSDSRIIKAILHRIADIPGGVTVDTGELGGLVLKEGTPLGYNATDGMYHVVKTALIVGDATDAATEYEVAKGHHFKVGDYFGTDGANGQAITAIDKTTNTDKDVITVGTTLGVAIDADDKVVAFQTVGVDKVAKVTASVIAGSNYDVEETNLFTDAWAIAVVRVGNSVPVPTSVKTALKGIHYVA